MRGKETTLILALAWTFACCDAAFAEAVSAGEAQKAFTLYQQHQYAAAASAFESIIRRQPSARYCYYAALAQHGNGKELRARQLFQYVITSYPSSAEAGYAKKALASVPAPVAAGTGANNSDDLPDSVKKLIPADMQKLLDTPMGKQALKQVMAQQSDQIDTIRKAEKAGVMKQDKLAAAVENAGIMTTHPEFNRDHPFTAQDIAKKGAHAIDQTRYPNCWFEASMASLAELPRGQKLIADMIRMKDKDTYVVRFPGDGQEYVITATDLAQSDVHDSALWASLLECAETRKFPDNKGAEGTYGDQSRLEIGLAAITGHKAEIIDYPKNSTVQELSAFIGGAVKSKNPVVCGTYAALPDPPLVVTRHAYTITDFDPSTNMITVRNPWGHNPEWIDLPSDPQHLQFQKLEDGVFKMSIPMFQKYFRQVARSFI